MNALWRLNTAERGTTHITFILVNKTNKDWLLKMKKSVLKAALQNSPNLCYWCAIRMQFMFLCARWASQQRFLFLSKRTQSNKRPIVSSLFVMNRLVDWVYICYFRVRTIYSQLMSAQWALYPHCQLSVYLLDTQGIFGLNSLHNWKTNRTWSFQTMCKSYVMLLDNIALMWTFL